VAGLLLTAPCTPMLFMGEEWGADTPWQFFTDHTDPGLAAAVSAGRRSEFAHHGWGLADVPDPQDEQTFLRSKLDWDQPAREPYRSMLGWYRALLALRRSRPELADPRFDRVQVDYDEDARWLIIGRGRLRVVANLGAADATIRLGESLANPSLLIASAPGISIAPGVLTMPPATFAIVDQSPA
jgi:maltooligosyltrehalose trehalohydrolase